MLDVISLSDVFQLQLFDSIEVYDPVTDTQETVEMDSSKGRALHRMVAYKRQLFVLGGVNKHEQPYFYVDR